MATRSLYTTLDYSSKQIRLLEFTATDPKLICNLTIVSLDESPQFAALSYQWGNAPPTEQMTVNGQDIAITPSLADAFRNMQMHWPDEPLRLWADAVCINQADIREKNHQVPLMTGIYSQAELTFCSLGPGDSATIVTAIDTLNLIARRTANHVGTATSWMLEELQVFAPDPSNRQVPIPGSEEWAGNKAQKALDEFMDLGYWKRAWIFQESVLSKNAIFFHTSRAINLSTALSVAAWARQVGLQARPRGIDALLWNSLQTFGQHKYLGAIAVSMLAIQLHDKYPVRQQGEAFLILRGLDIMGTQLQATDPKDYVYALLGLSGLDITPDYSHRVSVGSVYADFCAKRLNAMRSYDTPLDHLDFLIFAGHANRGSETLELPSWVPNFPSCSVKGGPYQIPYLTKRRVVPWGHSTPSASMYIKGLSLHIQAQVVTVLDDLSDALTTDEALWRGFAISLFDLLGKELENPSEHLGENIRRQHPLLKLASAFNGQHINGEIWESPGVLRVIRILQILLSEIIFDTTTPDCSDPFSWDLLDKMHLWIPWFFDLSRIYNDSEDHVPRNNQLVEDEHRRFVQQFIRILGKPGPVFLEQASTLQPPFPDILRFLRKILDRESAANWEEFTANYNELTELCEKGVRVARNMQNEFGLVPPAAMKDDVVVLFQGSAKLYLIREVEDYHVFIGPAVFPNELMDAMIDGVLSGGGNLSEFELR